MCVHLVRSIITVVLPLIASVALAQTAPQVGPSPAMIPAPETRGPSTPFHREGALFLDASPFGLGTEVGVSWGRDWQIGVWAGAYFPWFGQEFSAAPEAYLSLGYTFFGRVYASAYLGAGARLPDPGQVSLRAFTFLTTTHRLSAFFAATVFCTPQAWYPSTLRTDDWFFSFRAGPTFLAIPNKLKFQGYLETSFVPGGRLSSPVPGFIVLVFF